MDLLKDNIKKIFIRYLIPSMGSTIVMSIYSFADTIVVGQAVGPDGPAALAVIMPLFGLTAFLGILCGIGGSVMMSQARGEGNEEKGNAYFTAALTIVGILTVVFWLILGLFSEKVFTIFGANADMMPLVMEYGKWIILFCPFFIFSAFLACFIRNDNAPNLAMGAVIIGGVINIFSDWLLVFPLGMGMAVFGVVLTIIALIQSLFGGVGNAVQPYCIH